MGSTDMTYAQAGNMTVCYDPRACDTHDTISIQKFSIKPDVMISIED